VRRFTAQWLGIEGIANVVKDPETFPELDADLRARMLGETTRFAADVLAKESLPALFTAGHSFADAELAAFYGFDPPKPPLDAEGYGKVALDGTRRVGLLTQASVLATHAMPSGSSPIHRGKLVRERLLCQSVPPPPPAVNVQLPAFDPDRTTRQRFEAHATVEPCVSCHELMDPIGFAFEHYDGIGRWRDQDQDQSIDARGEIVGSSVTNASFDGAAELAGTLAFSPEVSACFALEWFRFGYGISEEPALRCLIDDLGRSFEAGGLRWQELVVAMTQAPHFTQRFDESGEPPPDDGAGGAAGAGGAGPGGTGGAGGAAGGGAEDAGVPPPQLEVQQATTTDWGTGYCAEVKVTNPGADVVDWWIEIAVEGTLTDVWNAVAEPAGTTTRFSGAAYNDLLDPGATTSFGYCATR
jgi:hypothetical protein